TRHGRDIEGLRVVAVYEVARPAQVHEGGDLLRRHADDVTRPVAPSVEEHGSRPPRSADSSVRRSRISRWPDIRYGDSTLCATAVWGRFAAGTGIAFGTIAVAGGTVAGSLTGPPWRAGSSTPRCCGAARPRSRCSPSPRPLSARRGVIVMSSLSRLRGGLYAVASPRRQAAF